MAIGTTFTKTVGSFKLTASGKRKLKQMESVAAAAIESAMVRTMPRYKKLLASFSPTATQEAQLLSEGQIFEGRYVSRGPRKGELAANERMVGTPTGGRFLRGGGMVSVRQAIARSQVIVGPGRGGRITVTTARAAEINDMTGFSWDTKHRGIQGPTWPYNHQLMQALEDGGVWEVRRQTQNLLNPEPGVYAGRMIKTLEPWGMYKKARVAIRDEMAANIKNDVAKALKGIG